MLLSSGVTALGAIYPLIPNFQGVSRRLRGEVGRPSQYVASLALTEPVASQHQALADLQRLRLESQFQIALHVIEEGIYRFLEDLPRSLRGFDIAPLMIARACVQVVIIQQPYFVFNLRRDVLILALVQE